MRPGLSGRGNPLGRGQVMEVSPQQIRPIGQGRGNAVGTKVTQVSFYLIYVRFTFAGTSQSKQCVPLSSAIIPTKKV